MMRGGLGLQAYGQVQGDGLGPSGEAAEACNNHLCSPPVIWGYQRFVFGVVERLGGSLCVILCTEARSRGRYCECCRVS